MYKDDMLAWLEKQGEQKSMKTCAEYYNQDNELKMPKLSKFQNKLADILMYREYDGPDETEDDIAKGRLEYELAAIRLSEELLPLAQEEQKLADKVEPKFHEGDWIIFNGLTLYIKEVVKGFYRTISKGGIANSYDWDIDNAARLWSIQDAKAGDVLVNKHGCPLIFKDKETCWCYYSISSEVFHPNSNKWFFSLEDYLYPATKEQRELLFKKMRDAGYEWDAEKKELKKIVDEEQLNPLREEYKMTQEDKNMIIEELLR